MKSEQKHEINKGIKRFALEKITFSLNLVSNAYGFDYSI